VGQGFGLGRPMGADEVLAWARGRAVPAAWT
jgi:hypothetical protein